MSSQTGGTVELDWASLSSELSERLVALLNAQLSSIPRPSFIGPITITSFDFGSSTPQVELIDIRDIYRDFLDDDEDGEESRPSASSSPAALNGEDEDGFEWVSRREGARAEATMGTEPGIASPYSYLPPHVRYGASSVGADFMVGHPGFHATRNTWDPRGVRVGGVGMGMSLPNLMRPPNFATPSLTTPSPHSRTPLPPVSSTSSINSVESSFSPPIPSQPTPTQSPPSTSSDLQLHFQINFESDLRLTLATSLEINYPSPLFMALPVKLSVTGLTFSGEVCIAYEGSRNRIHMCIIDPLDPYGPTARPPKPVPSPSSSFHESSTPLDSPGGAPSTKPPPIGSRLLPSILIESSIGQADKHVLTNVSRVERFIQDVMRKTIEEELVFPNFHTIVLGGGNVEKVD